MCVAGGVTMVTPKKLLPRRVAGGAAGGDAGVVHRGAGKVGELASAAWQVSQAAIVGICVAGGATGTMLAKLRPAAWQVAQPLVMPAWFIVCQRIVRGVGVAPRARLAWSGCGSTACAVTPVVNDVVELWQLAHSPVVGCTGSCAAVGRVTIVTPAKLLPVSWQVAQDRWRSGAWFIAVPPKLVNLRSPHGRSRRPRCVGMCVAGGVTMVTPAKLLPVAWQVAQPLVMPAWFIARAGKAGELGRRVAGLAGCVVGMCVGGGDHGTTPAKLSPPAWQVAQPLVMPAWFIVAPA